MNTAAAADLAGVTIPTVRSWCRIGAVAAAKRAGRWVIEKASLLRRVAIGKKKEKTVPLIEAAYQRLSAVLAGVLAHPAVQDALASGRIRRVPAVEAPAYDDARAPRHWVTRWESLLDDPWIRRDLPGAGPLSKACREFKLWHIELERHGAPRENHAHYINEALAAYDQKAHR